jgi:hypothetical protein
MATMMRAAPWQVPTNLVVRLTLQMTWIALTAIDAPKSPITRVFHFVNLQPESACAQGSNSSSTEERLLAIRIRSLGIHDVCGRSLTSRHHQPIGADPLRELPFSFSLEIGSYD